MLASTHTDDTDVFVAASRAVAVWLPLCGSTPMIMILGPLVSNILGHHGRHADFETHSGEITPLLVPDRSQPSTGRHTPGEPTQNSGRRFTEPPRVCRRVWSCPAFVDS